MLVGDRQTIIMDMFKARYPFVKVMINLWDIFFNDNVEEALQDIQLPACSKKLLEAMEVGLKRQILNKVTFYEEKPFKFGSDDNRQVCVCFSGGKDSLATTLKYKDLGYDIKLYKIDGVNKGYPKEVEAAKLLANKLNLHLEIEKILLKGKKFHIEHPLKNQLICSLALAYCLDNNIDTHIVFGDFKTDNYEKSHYGVDWSDCWEVWEGYTEFIRYYVPTFKVDIAFDVIDDSYEIISKHPELIQDYQSCLMNMRYRDHLNTSNKVKYNVEDMLPNRCGSCWKCAMEYIYFADKGVQKYNQNYYKHSLDILKKAFPSAKSELPIPKCNKDIYEGFFVKMKYKNDSIYYKNTNEE